MPGACEGTHLTLPGGRLSKVTILAMKLWWLLVITLKMMFNLKLQMQLSMIDNDCGRRWRHRRDRGRNGEWWSQHRKRRAKVGTNSNKLIRLTKYIRNTLQPSDNRPGGLPLPTSSRTACRACPGRAPSSPPRAPLGSSLARCLIRSSDVNISTWVCISKIALRELHSYTL